MKFKKENLPDDLQKAMDFLPAFAANVFLTAKMERLKYDAYIENGFTKEESLFLIAMGD